MLRRTKWTKWKRQIIVGAVVGLMCLASPQQGDAHSIAHEQNSNNDRVMAA